MMTLFLLLDINECEISNGGCQDVCINTIGSFVCNCSDGKGLNEDGRTCKEGIHLRRFMQ